MNITTLKSLLTWNNIKHGFRLLFTKGPIYVIKQLQLLYFPATQSYKTWKRKTDCTADELTEQFNTTFSYTPLISILVPAYHTPQNFLLELYNSVCAQSYANWELVFADANIDSPVHRGNLSALAKKDSRIQVAILSNNHGISENTNAAIQKAKGDYIALLDHDDTLAPNALFEIAKAINETSAEVIYTDEDKIDKSSKKYFNPYFKSDFNIDLLRNNNYICHLCVIKTSLVTTLGGLRPSFNGAQDYDLILRCCEATDKIYHIPKVLYHWRTHSNSTASNPESKQYAFDAGKHALEEHLQRCNLSGIVEMSQYPGFYRIHYDLIDTPLVSIIIPNKDHKSELKICIDSITKKSSYDNFEIVIVENNSITNEIFAYYDELKKNPKIKIISWNDEFNYSAINNFAVQNCHGEYLLLLNNDVEVITENWIEEMLMFAQRRDIGAVGAKLLYPDNTIQHAGVILGIGGVAGHSHKNYLSNATGYFNRLNITQNLSCVTAACLMVRKSIYTELSGLDEDFKVAFNDIDFCLRIIKAGYKNVFTPFAQLYHYESKSRGPEDSEEKINRFNNEIRLFQSRWKKELLKGDPYYNPNLTLLREDFSLKTTHEKPIDFLQ